MLQGPEDLAHPSLSGMRRYEDVLDVFRLRRRGLQSETESALLPAIPPHQVRLPLPGSHRVGAREACATDLDLGRALDGLFERARHADRLSSMIVDVASCLVGSWVHKPGAGR